MKKKYDFEYIIIGSGPAGSSAALNLAQSKKHTALIEAGPLGGSNINSSDIPFRVALDFSHSYAKTLAAPEFKNQDIHFSLPTVLNHISTVSTRARHDLDSSLKSAGVAHIEGLVNFLDPHTIAIGKHKLTSNIFILATGSHLKTSHIAGTDHVNFLTLENIFHIRRLPKIVLIIGGGPTGCEIASYLAELGVKVIIMEASSRLLPHEDKEVSKAITDYFTQKLDIMVLPNCQVVALEKDPTAKRVIFKNGRTEKNVRINNIILATGYEPNLNLGLENAKVKYQPSGIVTNRYFETSTKNIYAIGDCVHNTLSPSSSTTRADYEGAFLASNILGHSKNTINYRGFSRVIKTFPEVVSIGPSEEELSHRKRTYKKALVRFNQLPIGEISNDQGFVKLIVDGNARLIAASVVAPNAEMLAEELSLAIRHHLPAIELASTPHSVNSYSYAIKLAAKKLIPNKKKK